MMAVMEWKVGSPGGLGFVLGFWAVVIGAALLGGRRGRRR